MRVSAGDALPEYKEWPRILRGVAGAIGLPPLKASTPEEETYDLLEKVADGEKTIANLNKVR